MEEHISRMDTPQGIRRRIRAGAFPRPTAGLAPGFVQTNLVILQEAPALEFLSFCIRNSIACPLFDVLEPGKYEVPGSPGSDIRTDISEYRVYHNGALLERLPDVKKYWSADMVALLFYSASSLDYWLARAGFCQPPRDQGEIPPLYETNRSCRPAGRFHGNLVVTMRPIVESRISELPHATPRLPTPCCTPVHIGSPAEIGIDDLGHPNWGDSIPLRVGEAPVFWPSSFTSLAVIYASRPPLMIVNSPGHRLVTDVEESKIPNLFGEETG